MHTIYSIDNLHDEIDGEYFSASYHHVLPLFFEEHIQTSVFQIILNPQPHFFQWFFRKLLPPPQVHVYKPNHPQNPNKIIDRIVSSMGCMVAFNADASFLLNLFQKNKWCIKRLDENENAKIIEYVIEEMGKKFYQRISTYEHILYIEHDAQTFFLLNKNCQEHLFS